MGAGHRGGGARRGGTGVDDEITAPIALPVFASPGVGSDTVTTGSGADTISGSFGADTISAGGGADTIFGHQDADTIDAGAGNDTINGGAAADSMAGGAGSDLVDYAGSTAVTVTIDAGANDGAAGELDDVRTDVEQVRGSSGDDTITGSNLTTVPNTLIGSSGDDILIGLAGHDDLRGDKGSDTLQGGANDDRLDGGADADDMDGGAGTDLVSYAGKLSGEHVTADLDGLADDGEVGEGDRLDTTVENITGGDGGDTLSGDQFANALDGGFAGADTLNGFGGNDSLNGRNGPDALHCGADVDVADGGAQIDTATQCEQMFNVP
jgi:Ca2+-binding RTX toxin-like protein